MHHEETVKSPAEILGAMGLTSAAELRPWHIMRRISPTEVRRYGELFEWLEKESCFASVALKPIGAP
ncbi:MAG: hypothetical protein ACE5GA_08710 [Candidatus Zixiibacteriota bacterium]